MCIWNPDSKNPLRHCSHGHAQHEELPTLIAGAPPYIWCNKCYTVCAFNSSCKVKRGMWLDKKIEITTNVVVYYHSQVLEPGCLTTFFASATIPTLNSSKSCPDLLCTLLRARLLGLIISPSRNSTRFVLDSMVLPRSPFYTLIKLQVIAGIHYLHPSQLLHNQLPKRHCITRIQASRD